MRWGATDEAGRTSRGGSRFAEGRPEASNRVRRTDAPAARRTAGAAGRARLPRTPFRSVPWVVARRSGVLVVLGLLLVAGCGGDRYANPSTSTTTPSPRPPRPSPPAVVRPFAPDAVWNQPLADNAVLDPHSPELVRAFVADIARQRRAAIGPWIETTDSSTPVYTVPRDQPRVRVVLDGQQAYGRTLRRAFRAVPLPAGQQPARGPDRHLTVLQPATNSMWEFWHLRREDGQWRAAGGAMRDVSAGPGYFTRGSWPGGEPYWGATARAFRSSPGSSASPSSSAGASTTRSRSRSRTPVPRPRHGRPSARTAR